MRTLLVSLFCLCYTVTGLAGAKHASGPQWRDWSDAAFAEAKRDGKFVILDLEAVWCHWCHVMDEKTYTDPAVIKLLNEHYITIKVDHDARPDLARRYQEWGWPATIFFNADGVELVKRAGYIPPAAMAKLLQAIVDDPTPERNSPIQASSQFAASPLLGETLRKQLEQRHRDSYDREYGSLKINQKFIDRDSVEYALRRGLDGDAFNARRARHTLDAAMALLDPAWGGIYQYSTGGNWDYPHFEKIMQSQAGYMRVYSIAYRQFGDENYRKVAEAIAGYLHNFLTGPNGAFYTSQDADLVQGEHSREYFALGDRQRRARGIPHIDTHQYARENGWAATALVELYEATGKTEYLQRAERAMAWVEANRAIQGGGYRHDEVDNGGPFLGDNLAVGEAWHALYQATGKREYLARATAVADFIDHKFRFAGDKGAGYAVAWAPASAVIKPLPQIDENIAVTRFMLRLYHLTGNQAYKAMAERGMRYLGTPSVALDRLTEAGILLAANELASDPVHMTVVGHKDDALAQQLYREALRYPGSYRRIEWWDKREGAMPNPDVQYPALPRAAAFACANQRCSLPVFAVDDVHGMVDALYGRR